eukprot:49994-Amorphochlora_amoeboformis.AAC.2
MRVFKHHRFIQKYSSEGGRAGWNRPPCVTDGHVILVTLSDHISIYTCTHRSDTFVPRISARNY